MGMGMDVAFTSSPADFEALRKFAPPARPVPQSKPPARQMRISEAPAMALSEALDALIHPLRKGLITPDELSVEIEKIKRPRVASRA
jgi:hypothetical protein